MLVPLRSTQKYRVCVRHLQQPTWVTNTKQTCQLPTGRFPGVFPRPPPLTCHNSWPTLHSDFFCFSVLHTKYIHTCMYIRSIHVDAFLKRVSIKAHRSRSRLSAQSVACTSCCGVATGPFEGNGHKILMQTALPAACIARAWQISNVGLRQGSGPISISC